MIFLLQGALDLLVNFGSSDGLFLVRPSSRKKNFFVLCLTSKSYPFNYEISENVSSKSNTA